MTAAMSGTTTGAPGAVRRAREAFRRFRRTRPFWAGLIVLVAGIEIGFLPLGPYDVLIHAGLGVLAGLGCSVALLVMGLVILLLPSQRLVAGLITVLVSILSFLVTNLGGFVVGMVLGVVGGSLAFGWVPDKPVRRRRLRRAPPPDAAPARPRPAPSNPEAS